MLCIRSDNIYMCNKSCYLFVKHIEINEMNTCTKFALSAFQVGRNKTAFTVAKRFNKIFSSNMSFQSFDMVKEKAKMLDAWPKVTESLLKHPKFQELPVVKDWIQKVLDATVTGGKLSRGLVTIMSFKLVESPENITEETIRLAYVLGWCTEIAYCTVLDDIMDGSSTRRGMPCWYRREDVGIGNAINDACLIHACLHQLLREHFETRPVYVKLYQTFNETLLYTCMGQFLDSRGSQVKNNYDLFTKEYYNDIVTNKSAYYTFYLPISIGLMLSNQASEESLRHCKEISLQIGKLFQMQDDYLDCFGDELFTGKIGTDIQERKCTWLAVNALLRCNVKHRAVFSACYGSNEPAHVERIKQLYIQLQIPQLYKNEEQAIYNNIKHRIAAVPSAAEREVYQKVLDLTYNRKK